MQPSEQAFHGHIKLQRVVKPDAAGWGWKRGASVRAERGARQPAAPTSILSPHCLQTEELRPAAGTRPAPPLQAL